MKAFVSLFLMAGLVWFFQPTKEDPNKMTRGAIMEDQIKSFTAFAVGLEFDCNKWEWPSGYAIVAEHLEVELTWSQDVIDHDDGSRTVGLASKEEIIMLLPPCHPEAKATFFHEVGHVLFRHNYKEINELLTQEEQEGEANYFSKAILEALSFPVPKRYQNDAD